MRFRFKHINNMNITYEKLLLILQNKHRCVLSDNVDLRHKNEREVISFFYTFYKKKAIERIQFQLKNMNAKMAADEDAILEIYHSALERFYDIVQKGWVLEQGKEPHTYFNKILHLVSFEEARKYQKSYNIKTVFGDDALAGVADLVESNNNNEAESVKQQKNKVFDTVFQGISKKCQNLFLLLSQGLSPKEIVEQQLLQTEKGSPVASLTAFEEHKRRCKTAIIQTLKNNGLSYRDFLG